MPLKTNYNKNYMEKINFETKNGKPYYNGYLDLRGTGITSLPNNLTKGEWGNSTFANFFK